MKIQEILNDFIPEKLKSIINKIINSERITESEALILFGETDLSLLGVLATYRKEQLHGKKVFFNKNFHIEPTNICVYNCKFCSYRRSADSSEAWLYSLCDIKKIAEQYQNKDVTEVHIVGGVHPDWDLDYFCKLINEIRLSLPKIHIKAFSAIELDYMIKKAGLKLNDGLLKLKEAGLNSIPGGGAEIFNDEIRKEICGEKSSTEVWLNVHERIHKIGLSSNATILYGHIENYEHRIDHLRQLRELQDKTKGFNAFIPLKYRNQNNMMSEIGEVNMIEDMKNYAISRIYLDNIPHLKAYWPMIGKDAAQLSLSFGVDDMDGTIDDTTKIYSMAGVEEQKPTMSTNEIIYLIKEAGQIPVERNSVYEPIKTY